MKNRFRRLHDYGVWDKDTHLHAPSTIHPALLVKTFVFMYIFHYDKDKLIRSSFLKPVPCRFRRVSFTIRSDSRGVWHECLKKKQDVCPEFMDVLLGVYIIITTVT